MAGDADEETAYRLGNRERKGVMNGIGSRSVRTLSLSPLLVYLRKVLDEDAQNVILSCYLSRL